MLDNLNELLDKISNYLLSKKYKKTSSGGDLYFVNKKETPSIVRIAIDEFDVNREQLDLEIKSLTKDEISPSIIEILLTYKKGLELSNVIIVDSFAAANKVLSKQFKNFKVEKNVVEKEEEAKHISAEELIANLQNPSKSSDEKLKKVINSFENPTIYTKLFAGVFVLVPVMVFIVALFIFSSNSFFSKYGNTEINNLFFGALDYKLTVVANQWWRILTYGLAPDYQVNSMTTIIQLVLFGWITYIMVKYASSMLGILKAAGTFALAYVITGFALAFVAQTSSISGQIIPLAIITGLVSAVVVNPTKKTSGMFLTLFTKRRLVLPYIALVLYLLFFSKNVPNDFLYIGMGFGMGFLASIIVNFDYNDKKNNKDKAWVAPLVIVVSVVVVMMILVFINKYNPAINSNTIYTLALQVKMGLISLDKANDILLNNLKWEIKIEIIDDLIRIVNIR
ncbi:rhomboid protease GluP [Spiroplasma sp. TIUS-1]|uniref:MHS family MFS transporter n=1 Tax=Spiroplasma sp. TIUS-1 TaxID=216963 RepID=UPI001397390B|nr:MHS family MFS transporter [Spiroplasma sp. TIUS-1]QHX35991.1 rhomboid protease GluP [Spiroplasma sp. TIUS-1]